MKILVTGGAGFIGSHYVKYALQTHPEAEMCCLDSLTYAGDPNNVGEAMTNPRFGFVKGDITDREIVFDVFARFRPDTVVHFAAETHVDRAITDPGIFVRTNVLGTENLLEASKEYGVKRFHQVSTDEVYGDLPKNSKDAFDETSPLRPSSPYSASKAAADLLVLSYARTYGLSVTISRSSNNYGPNQNPEKLIPLLITRAKKGLPLPIYGDGKNVRDWIYVGDHVTAIDRILTCGKPGEIYNVGAGEEKTNLEIAASVIEQMNGGEVCFVEDRKGHDERYAMKTDKLRSLGWSPQMSFSAGLSRTIEFYSK